MLNQILNSRYQIKEQLGKNVGRKTFLAQDLTNQKLVVIKLLFFNEEFDWKNLTLFEREASVLKKIQHPAIPKYLDYFDVEFSDKKGFALVQTYIDAQSLAEQVTSGRKFTELEIKQLAQAILDILDYLHSYNPPIIHRDIKPSNLLSNDRSGNHIGQVYLVDFGAVQTVAAQQDETLTIVGTYGYMPPEQFGRRTLPASDLYSLGATLIFLLTNIHPADLPTQEGRIQFEGITNQITPQFSNWLIKLIQPSLDSRFLSAKQALEALKFPIRENSIQPVNKPPGSPIILTKSDDKIQIMIPPIGFEPSLIAIILFGIAWNSFIFFWTGAAIFAPFPFNIMAVLFSLPFWGVGISMIGGVLFCLWGQIYLLIDQKQIRQTYKLFGFKYAHPKPSPRREIHRLERTEKTHKRDSDGDQIEVPASLAIWGGHQEYTLKLSDPELDWLAHELSNWLDLPIKKKHHYHQ
ncbi:serine/threonine-protein kinase [Crocosphaera sp. UHCC 0190]|uniref:serine/threonine protein kinase n=1 Tax=Crocosphaera sp. UHCC 0190 TaxID=3110246 RepID=UPI002B21C847|nr:serine/threonine-protein kinase [Crocosphaera sp. UHCC 0190]MEA5511378.1 serine/threonine-protein kinase [Crocosphaera sp. UHCC 0190]